MYHDQNGGYIFSECFNTEEEAKSKICKCNIHKSSYFMTVGVIVSEISNQRKALGEGYEINENKEE